MDFPLAPNQWEHKPLSSMPVSCYLFFWPQESPRALIMRLQLFLISESLIFFFLFFFPVVVDERGCFEHELCKNIRYFYKCALLCHFYFFRHSGWGRTLPHSWSLSKLIHGKVPQSSHGAAHLFAQMTALLSHQSSCFFETSIRLWSQRVIGKEFPPCQRFRKDWRESADHFLRALQDFSGFHGIKYPLRLGRVKWKQAALTVCTWRDNG